MRWGRWLLIILLVVAMGISYYSLNEYLFNNRSGQTNALKVDIPNLDEYPVAMMIIIDRSLRTPQTQGWFAQRYHYLSVDSEDERPLLLTYDIPKLQEAGFYEIVYDVYIDGELLSNHSKIIEVK